MKKIESAFSLIFIIMMPDTLTMCERNHSETPPGDPVQIELSPKQKEVVESANKFAFDLFVSIVTEKKGAENIMISPFSVASALSMTLNGAAGETYDAMRQTLRYEGKTIEEINDAYLKLMKNMLSHVREKPYLLNSRTGRAIIPWW